MSFKPSVKVEIIQRILNFYYKDPPIPLTSINEFTFLVAVVLSAQTTDGVVNNVTKELFSRASSPIEMAKLSPIEVQNIIQSVGLANKKAEYIVNLSKRLVEVYDGKVPSTIAELKSLPGVGHKTASVIMSQVFGVPAIAVDTHVHRLALRWGLSKETRNPDKVQVDLCNAFPRHSWNKLHLQMIYFGREFCSAKAHEPKDCPICSWVNKKEIGDECCEAGLLRSFAPKPKSKGIVYYAERMEELQSVSSPFMLSMTRQATQNLLPEGEASVNVEILLEPFDLKYNEEMMSNERRVEDKDKVILSKKRHRE